MPASQLRGCTSDKEWGRRRSPEADTASSLFQFPGPTRVESRGRGSRAIGADPLGYCHTLSPKGSPEMLWGGLQVSRWETGGALACWLGTPGF